MRAACFGASHREVKKRIRTTRIGRFLEVQKGLGYGRSRSSPLRARRMREDDPMTKSMVRCAWVAGVLALAMPSAAAAQFDWEQGEGSGQTTAQTTDGSTTGSTTGTGSSTSSPSSSSSSSSSSASSSVATPAPQGDDHERVVGHLAVGYLGISNVPMGTLANTVTAPAIGIRYWFASLVGLDVGLGFGWGTSNNDGNPQGDGFGMTIHAGAPIAPAHSDHFVFEITPEANLGFTNGHQPTGPTTDDIGLTGVLFQLGGRVGTELHFGFIGVPQLSLTASVGLYFQYQQAVTSPPSPGRSVGQDAASLGTTVMGQPWQIFAGTISAFYYF
jgi:hypothetical protein